MWLAQLVQLPESERNQGIMVIDVGPSRDSRTKEVDMPERDMVLHEDKEDGGIFNYQDPEWPDKFKITVDGKKMTVRRIDSETGWVQYLQVKVKSQGKAQEEARQQKE